MQCSQYRMNSIYEKWGKNGQCTCDADCETKGLRAMQGVKNDEGDKNDGD